MLHAAGDWAIGGTMQVQHGSQQGPSSTANGIDLWHKEYHTFTVRSERAPVCTCGGLSACKLHPEFEIMWRECLPHIDIYMHDLS